jgi:hypothetical protein
MAVEMGEEMLETWRQPCAACLRPLRLGGPCAAGVLGKRQKGRFEKGARRGSGSASRDGRKNAKLRRGAGRQRAKATKRLSEAQRCSLAEEQLLHGAV